MAKVAQKGQLPTVLEEFAAKYPEVWDAYNRMSEAAEKAGPLDERTQRLVKLAIAIRAQQEGAVHSHTRRALKAGIAPEELIQVGILAVRRAYPQQPGPACGPHIDGIPLPFDEPNTIKLPKTRTIFLLPHFGQVGFNPFSFSEMVARISTFSLHSVQAYS